VPALYNSGFVLQVVGVSAMGAAIGLCFVLWPLQILRWARPGISIPSAQLKWVRFLGVVVVVSAVLSWVTIAVAVWMSTH
jgi:hypothetical protein